jgi:hypothetical protein
MLRLLDKGLSFCVSEPLDEALTLQMANLTRTQRSEE